MAKPSVKATRAGLRAEQRQLADTRILDGAIAVFAERGLRGTVDDVADACGVSRRTVFRHFDSHGELFAAAIRRIVELFEAELPGPPAPGEELEPWLCNVAERLHDLHRRLVGRGFWWLQADGSDVVAEIETVRAERHQWRKLFAARLASHAWSIAAAAGQPPDYVVEAFAVFVSGFGAAAMRSYTVKDAGQVSGAILTAVVTQAAGRGAPGS